MTNWKTTAFKAGLDALYFSGAHHMLAPFARGTGVIFTLHHVREASGRRFSPNRILQVTPDFLDAVIERVRTHDIDIVSIDEAHRRLTTPGEHKRFVVFTFDDGYRDNLEVAYPIMKKHDAPLPNLKSSTPGRRRQPGSASAPALPCSTATCPRNN